MLSNFIHLRTHSSYSLSEGAIKVNDLVKLCTRQQMPAVAITDNGNLFCSLEFSKECASNGVQPIIGCVLNLDPELAGNRIGSGRQEFDKIVLYAQNERGYKNLLKLVSKSFFYSNDAPSHVKFADLVTYNQGLIALSGNVDGTVGRLLLDEQGSQASEFVQQLQHVFADRLYIELMRHNLAQENKIESKLIDLAYQFNLPLVATNDVYFATQDMHEAHDVLLCIAEGRYVIEDDRKKLSPEHYFKTGSQMQELFSDLPEAINNTLVIAQRCGVKAEERAPMLPGYSSENGLDEAAALRLEAIDGLTRRLESEVFTADMSIEAQDQIRQQYLERLEYELNLIINMNFPGYFLIVSDFIKWSKRNDIPVGPGRGSGAGSVVAWCLEITDLNPLRFGLLFERFLNPERVSMPDFDIDFCQTRRDEVIEYVRQKYGQDQVANIITFGKLQARAVIRDVGRVLQMPYGQVDRISKMVPFNAVNPVNLTQAIDMVPELRKARDEDEHVSKLLSIALRLEGLNRHASTHAAGIVIAGTKLDELVPLYKDSKSDALVVQYSMKYAEAAGLVKFDFLGLKTLTVIADCIKLIKKRGTEIDITKIPLNDHKTYQMLSRGEATGVFQFESAGMKDALRKMRPDAIEDLIALGALYRPGPMDNIPTYIARKHGLEEPDYLHPKLEKTLKETFGVIIYQEQVMEIAQLLSGYTLGAADLLRRAMGKKIKAEMDAQRQLFVEGAVNNGVDRDQASSIFDLVAKFAGYGFNKSHAAAYALISYQTAYLKANYPAEFLTASCNLEIDDTDKINIFCEEAKRAGLKVLPPDLNKSEACFAIEHEDGKDVIRYGLGALKNVGLQAMMSLVEERKSAGAFKDVVDFAARLDSKILNKRQMENLVKAGAFDSLGANRRQIFESLDMLTKYNSTMLKEKASKQRSLFGGTTAVSHAAIALPEVLEWQEDEKVRFEGEAIGFYLISHPLDKYKTHLTTLGVKTSAYLKEEMPNGFESVKIAGIVSATKVRVSPKGRYVIITVSDSHGSFEVSIFDDKILAASGKLLAEKAPVLLIVDARKDEGGIRLTASSVVALDEFMDADCHISGIWVNSVAAVEAVKSLCQSKPGYNKIKLVVVSADREVEIEIPGELSINVSNLVQLESTKGVLKLETVRH